MCTFTASNSLVHKSYERSKFCKAKYNIRNHEGYNIRFTLVKGYLFFTILHGEKVNEGGKVYLINKGFHNIPNYDVSPECETDTN